MAITQAMPASFKKELMQCYHLFQNGANPARTSNTTPDVIKMALYVSAATMDKTTTAYSTSNEVATGGGYTAGGNTLTISTAPTSDTAGGVNAAYISFTDSAWTTSTFTARGALIYNSTQGDRAIAVLDFGSDKTVTSGTFTVQFPTYSSGVTAAIIQIG